MTPPAVIYGKTGEAIPVNPDAPWDAVSWFICAMISTVGYDTTRRLLGEPT